MITVNLDKAKEIAHQIRRNTRTQQFGPLDIQVTIPAHSEQAEAERQAIRDESAELQVQIDEASTVDELLKIVGNI